MRAFMIRPLILCLALAVSGLAGAQSIDMEKLLAPGQSPSPRSGDPVVFRVIVHNLDFAPIATLDLVDILDPCMTLASCADVVCAGAQRCGTCTANGSGFDYTGFGLAPAFQPGDTMVLTVTVSAGTTPGLCSNTVLINDPLSGADLSSSALVNIGGALLLRKDLAGGQNPTPAPGAPVTFVITLRNGGSLPVTGDLTDLLDSCFTPLPNCSAVTCLGGTTCGTCAVDPSGFTLTGYGLAPAGQPGDTLTVQVATTAGSTPGVCRNTALTADPSGLDLSDDATVDIGGAQATLEITKDLAPGQNPAPAPGAPVAFVITLRNIGPLPLTNLDLLDLLDACFDPITDCAQVVCSGGASCGTCALTGTGFQVTGIALASSGQVGDTISFTVSTLAGTTPGPCANTALATDPGTGTDLSDSASVDIGGTGASVALDKSLALGQDPAPDPGDPVVFVITLRNLAATPVTAGSLSDSLDPCFVPFSSCSQVLCSGGTSCGTCTPNPGGFDITGFGLAAAGQAGDILVVTITTTAGSVPGPCVNTAVTADPLTGQDLSDTATVDIAVPGTVSLRKDLAPGQSPTVSVGQSVAFAITIRNNTPTGSLAGLDLTDTFDACLDPLLGCGQVVCTGGTACGTCAVTTSGFTVTGFALAPSGLPGDTIVFTVSTTAGFPANPCRNTAAMDDPVSGGAVADTAFVDIQATTLCDLVRAQVTFPPIAPSKAGGWVYTTVCTSGNRLAGPNEQSPVVDDVDLTTDFAATAGGQMILYQESCSCSDRTAYTKNRATGKVHINLF